MCADHLVRLSCRRSAREAGQIQGREHHEVSRICTTFRTWNTTNTFQGDAETESALRTHSLATARQGVPGEACTAALLKVPP